jgi:NAD(P)-dependent dehydrogenase (short-subunit alcohol dehydrogenase family)
MQHYKGKIAVVTGGASGIGRALCEKLGASGAIVIIADINLKGAQQVAADISKAGGRASAASVDVSKQDEVQELVETTVKEHGRLDFMFNNAGYGIGGELFDVTDEQWKNIMDVNLWGVIYGTMAAYRVMIKQKSGHIVNMGSIAGLTTYPMGAPYATTKHAIIGLSKSLKEEAVAYGVNVSVACPAIIGTSIFDNAALAGSSDKGSSYEKYASKYLKLAMSPSKCADAVLHDVAKNKPIIIVTLAAKIMWFLYRIHPGLLKPLNQLAVKDFRKLVLNK